MVEGKAPERKKIRRKQRMSFRGFILDEKGQVGKGLIGIVIAFIFSFYVVSSTYAPLEDSAVSLKDSLGNATITSVQNLADLPGVAVLLFMLAVIFGLIMFAIARTGIS
jgi:hypothetical protein